MVEHRGFRCCAGVVGDGEYAGDEDGARYSRPGRRARSGDGDGGLLAAVKARRPWWRARVGNGVMTAAIGDGGGG